MSSLLQPVNTRQTTNGSTKNISFTFKNNLLIIAQKYKSKINQPITVVFKKLFAKNTNQV
jgi:hypothetical protein